MSRGRHPSPGPLVDAGDDARGVETPGILPAPEDDEAAGRPVHTPDELRRALGRFATGVTLVTCRDAAGSPVGLTANSFNALSLHPPLVLWSLRVESPSAQAFMAASHFAVNVLAAGQVALSRHFARPDSGEATPEGCSALSCCSEH